MNFTPYFSEKPWGGDFISKFYRLEYSRKIGEAFLVSTLKGYESFVEGLSLSKYLKSDLPYLIKVITGQKIRKFFR